MDFLDLLFIVLYFGIILWIARWASTEKKGSTFSSVDYFLAGKNQGWLVIGASMFYSNIGSEIILGVSGAGATREAAIVGWPLLQIRMNSQYQEYSVTPDLRIAYTH